MVAREDQWSKRIPEKKGTGKKIPFKFFHGLHRNPENNFSRAKKFSQKSIFDKIQMHATVFPSQRDFRKNIFSKREIFGTCCSCPENFRATVLKNFQHTQSRFFSNMREKLFKTRHKCKFSDVIAIAGNQGHFLPVSREKLPERCVKIRCPQNLAKLHGKIVIKIVIF